MINLKNFLHFLFLSILCYSCTSKYSVQKLNEIEKIKINEKRYLNKSVNKLIKDLKINIVEYRANLGNEAQNYLAMRFYSKGKYRELKNVDGKISPAYLYIFLSDRNSEVDKLFVDEKYPDSIYYKKYKRNETLNTNKKLIYPYRKLKLNMIYAKSEIEK